MDGHQQSRKPKSLWKWLNTPLIRFKKFDETSCTKGTLYEAIWMMIWDPTDLFFELIVVRFMVVCNRLSTFLGSTRGVYLKKKHQPQRIATNHNQ